MTTRRPFYADRYRRFCSYWPWFRGRAYGRRRVVMLYPLTPP